MPSDFEKMVARFTPEQRAIYEGQVKERLEAVLGGQPWVHDWLMEPSHPWEDPEASGWVRSRPDNIKALMLRFPPKCLVSTKTGVKLMVPAPGTFGIVMGYYESKNGLLLGVVQSPTAEVICQCKEEDMVLMACHEGGTPEDIQKVIDGKENGEDVR